MTQTSQYRVSRSADLWPPLIAAAVGVAAIAWMTTGNFKQDVVILTATYALVALGLYIPFVMAGSLSMAYSAYGALGAYGVAIISDRTGVPLWLGWIIGAVISAVVATGLSLATRRLSGFFLAAVTLLFATAFETWIVAAEELTGGPMGLGDLRDVSFLGWEPTRLQQGILGVIFVIAVTWFMDRLRRSSWGVIARTLSHVPLPIEASGVRVANMITVSLAVGAAVASLGGALFTGYVGSTTPETFTLNLVFLAIFMPLIGGRGTAWGAVIGAIVVVQLTVNFPFLQASGQLLLAIAVLLILLVAPGGLLGYVDRGRHWLQQMTTRRKKALS